MESRRRQRFKDARLALWVLMGAVFVGFLLGRATEAKACDSYEACKDYADGLGTKYSGSESSYDHAMLKAIAYKLDEISKKLDKKENK